MASSFVQRRLSVSISLAEGEQPFAESGTNTVTLPRLRTSAHITHAGGPSDSMMDLTIYGMTEPLMNRLSTLGMQINLVPKNGVVLSAGDDESGMATAFIGYILAAYTDFNALPEVAFRISAQCAIPQSVAAVQATSFRGSADVATIMSGLATEMGLQFENNGITSKLSNPYFSGSSIAKMRSCARAAGINANVINGVLAIWPKNGSRGGEIPEVSAATGMIGYPSYTAYGLLLRTLYNRSIGFMQKIKVVSDLKPANGVWAVYGLDHDLEAEVIGGGKWESQVSAYNPKFPPPVGR